MAASIADAISKGVTTAANANPETAAVGAAVDIVKKDPAKLAGVVLFPMAGAVIAGVIVLMIFFKDERKWIGPVGFGVAALLVGAGIYGLFRRPPPSK
jgi:hypothetical protein